MNQSFPSQEDFNEKVRPRIAEISSLVGHEEQVCCPTDEPLPHSELVLYAMQGKSPSYPLATIEEPMFPAYDSLDWVLQNAKKLGTFVTLWGSCEGFEEELMALLTAISKRTINKRL